MTKTILITGATDGIGLRTAEKFAAMGHTLLLHGRNEAKLAAVKATLEAHHPNLQSECYVADLAIPEDVVAMADAVLAKHTKLDVLINNAGIFKTPVTRTSSGLDVRFAVNTVAPYLLALKLRPVLQAGSRVVNLSSAAQAPVDVKALKGQVAIAQDFSAYAQSKLALTIWNHALAKRWGKDGPVMIAVNPGSLLGSKMVQEGFGVAGGDLDIGANILCEAALASAFAGANGLYFDNDVPSFSQPHPFAEDAQQVAAIMATLDHYANTLSL